MFSDSKKAGFNNSGSRTKSIRRKERRHTLKYRLSAKEKETNETFLQYLSNYQISDSQVGMLSKVSTPVTNECEIRHQLLQDFEQFAICKTNAPPKHLSQTKQRTHPFHVKYNWIPPVQPSIANESDWENVKTQLAEIIVTKPKNKLSRSEVMTLKELKNNSVLNLKKANKGTTVILNNYNLSEHRQ